MAQKRRSNHEGSIRKREDRGGQYQFQQSMPDGRRVTRSFKTEREGKAWLKEMQGHANRGVDYDLANLKLKDGLTAWLTDKKRNWKPKTYQQNANVVNNHVLPQVPASLKVVDTKPAHVKTIITAVQETCRANDIGTRTIRYARNMLFAYFESLCNEQVLLFNPVKPITVEHESKEMKVLDLSQIHRLFAAAKNTYLEHLWYIDINTGMRQGEVLGLRWSDIHFGKRCVITLQQQVQWLYGKDLPPGEPRYAFRSLKTKKSRRPIELGPKATQILKDQRERVMTQRLITGKKWDEHDLVFPNHVGRPLEPTNVTKALKKLLKQAELPGIRFHDLRHTSATVMLLMCIHPKIVSERLGHSSVQITLDLYSHVLPGLQELVAMEMDMLLDQDAQPEAEETNTPEKPIQDKVENEFPTPEQPNDALNRFDEEL
jgi:integrase